LGGRSGNGRVFDGGPREERGRGKSGFLLRSREKNLKGKTKKGASRSSCFGEENTAFPRRDVRGKRPTTRR